MPRSIALHLFILLLCLIPVCCSNGENLQRRSPVDPEEVVFERFRGHIVFGHEVRSFHACGSEVDLWVTDLTGLLWNLHQEIAAKTEPYEEVFFVLFGRIGPPPEEGFGADYSGELLVEEILYAAWEGFSCGSDLTGFSYRANGNEPFWSAEVSDRGLELRRLGEPDLSWVDLSRQSSLNGVIFQSKGPSADTPVVLEVISAPCRDSMSGAFYGYESKLRIGTEEFQGCALKGDS